MSVEKNKRVAVTGAGKMRDGIAREFVLAGFDVRPHDLDSGKLRRVLSAPFLHLVSSTITLNGGTA